MSIMDVKDNFLFVVMLGLILAPFGDASKSAITVYCMKSRYLSFKFCYLALIMLLFSTTS